MGRNTVSPALELPRTPFCRCLVSGIGLGPQKQNGGKHGFPGGRTEKGYPEKRHTHFHFYCRGRWIFPWDAYKILVGCTNTATLSGPKKQHWASPVFPLPQASMEPIRRGQDLCQVLVPKTGLEDPIQYLGLDWFAYHPVQFKRSPGGGI